MWSKSSIENNFKFIPRRETISQQNLLKNTSSFSLTISLEVKRFPRPFSRRGKAISYTLNFKGTVATSSTFSYWRPTRSFQNLIKICYSLDSLVKSVMQSLSSFRSFSSSLEVGFSGGFRVEIEPTPRTVYFIKIIIKNGTEATLLQFFLRCKSF